MLNFYSTVNPSPLLSVVFINFQSTCIWIFFSLCVYTRSALWMNNLKMRRVLVLSFHAFSPLYIILYHSTKHLALHPILVLSVHIHKWIQIITDRSYDQNFEALYLLLKSHTFNTCYLPIIYKKSVTTRLSCCLFINVSAAYLGIWSEFRKLHEKLFGE